jgi:8-oxo-dGTP diphosphatase
MGRLIARRPARLGSYPLAVANSEIGRCALGAACALFDGDQVLLVRHTYGRLNWELPGGVSLPGEDPAATARRELREETGLDLLAEQLTGVYFEPTHDFGSFLHVVFRFGWAEGLAPIAMPPEIGDVGFWPLDNLPRPLSDFTHRRIVDAHLGGASFAVIEHRSWLP